MNRKLITVVIIMAVIPIGLLSWMGFTSIRSEEERARQQIQFLGNGKLELVRDNISGIFKVVESEIASIFKSAGFKTENIRAIQRKSNLVKQIFILGRDGFIYPSSDTPLSDKEKDFLNRIKEADISYNFLSRPSDENVGRLQERGWHTWLMGEGINFIYWQKAETLSGETVILGAELNRAAALSRIINSLPDTNPENDLFRISLFGVTGSILYQWGGYAPLEEISADAVLPLAPPLTSWHLSYSIDPAAAHSGGNRLFIAGSLLTILVVIVSLSIYLYKESTREMREARLKVSFVNQVSHELKTPLTNIRMYAELLEGRIRGDDKKSKSYLNIVISESRRLSRMINNVLSFAKDQKDKISFNPAPAVPDDVVERTLDNFSYSLAKKGIEVVTDLNAGKPVMLDADILEQILSNLISNAEKYAAAGKWIKVESLFMRGTTTLIVSDRGPGIPRSSIEKIFEPFFRVSNKLTDGVSGTGIGLSLVRKLAEIHGGRAELLYDDASTEGAVFRVTLKTPLEGI